MGDGAVTSSANTTRPRVRMGQGVGRLIKRWWGDLKTVSLFLNSESAMRSFRIGTSLQSLPEDGIWSHEVAIRTVIACELVDRTP